MQTILTRIANEAHKAHNDVEFRGLYLANDNEQVMNQIKENVSNQADFEKQMWVEIGYNYSDSSNLSYGLFGWHKIFGFDLRAIDTYGKITLDDIDYFKTILKLMNDNFEELHEAFQAYLENK